MLNEGLDANLEKETPADSSTEEKTPEVDPPNNSEVDKTQEEELGSGIASYDERFKKVYAAKKMLERENAELKSSKAGKESPEAPNKDVVPKSWEEVFELLEQRQQTKAQAEQKRIEEVTQKINTDISEAKKVFPDLKDDEVWEYMAKNNINNVFEATTKLYANQKPTNKEQKAISSKIGAASKSAGTASDGKGLSYDQIHRMSLDDIQLSGK